MSSKGSPFVSFSISTGSSSKASYLNASPHLSILARAETDDLSKTARQNGQIVQIGAPIWTIVRFGARRDGHYTMFHFLVGRPTACCIIHRWTGGPVDRCTGDRLRLGGSCPFWRAKTDDCPFRRANLDDRPFRRRAKMDKSSRHR
jgi:hypothetical protein